MASLIPPLRRRRRETAAIEARAEELAYQRSVQVLAKSFLGADAATTPGTSWSSQGTGPSSALLARVTQNLAQSFGRAPADLEVALAEQGLSWGPPFPPGRPLDPFWGYKRPPRNQDYSVGENVQITPRFGRISFATLKAIYDAYDVAQIVVRHLINDVRSLDYAFVPPLNVAEDASDDIAAAERFFSSPDKRQPFRAWLAEYLQDVLRYDAGALFVRRNEMGDAIALEVVTGPTIIPLLDFYGRVATDEDDDGAGPEHLWPGKITPAYLQIVQGLPWVWLTKDQLIYQPLNPLPDSQYGLSPLEAVLLTANTDVRFQWHFLQYFTEGTVPAGFMEAPPDLSDPAQIEAWQQTWDALMVGDQAKLRQVRWVPAGSKFQPAKPAADAFDDKFPLYLMRRICAAYGVTPNDLGFTEDVNRSTGEIQMDVQFRVGTLPLVRHVEDVINLFLAEDLKLKARIQFDTGQGTQHRLETARANDIYINNGTLSPDEVRISLGKRISRERPTPRFVNNGRAGPIPLLALDSLSGEIDYMTYGPHKGQPLIDHPFVSAPGVAPVIGSTGHKGAQNATANMQDNMILENVAPAAPGHVLHPSGRVQETPGLPKPPGSPPGTDDAGSSGEEAAAKALEEAFGVIDLLLDRLEAAKGATLMPRQGAPDNTGGPGVPRGFSNAVTAPDQTFAPDAPVPTTYYDGQTLDMTAGMQHELPASDEDEDEDDKAARRRARKVTAGVTAATGIEGNPLAGTQEDDDEDEAVRKAVRQWRDNARSRLRKGLPPRRFEDVPADLADAIWRRLEHARTREEVDRAFALRKEVDAKERAAELLRPEMERLMASAARVDAARDALLLQAAKGAWAPPPPAINVLVQRPEVPDVFVDVAPAAAPEVHVHEHVTVEAAPAPDVHVHAPVTVEGATVTPPDVHVHAPVSVKAPAPKVEVQAPPAPSVNVTVEGPGAPKRTTARRNPDGSVVIERSED